MAACGGPETKAEEPRAETKKKPARSAPALSPRIVSVTPATGPAGGGNQVGIAVRDMAGTPRVYFGGREAKIVQQRADNQMLMVEVPPGPAGLAVEVVVVGEQQAALSNGYRYQSRSSDVPPDKPKVTAAGFQGGIEICEEYFDLVERCAPGMGSAIKQARDQFRKMAENASPDELDKLSDSCRVAMDAVAKSFTNCKQP